MLFERLQADAAHVLLEEELRIIVGLLDQNGKIRLQTAQSVGLVPLANCTMQCAQSVCRLSSVTRKFYCDLP